MDEWELPKYYRDKIVLFYHDFWKRRRGIITLPRVINLLPINLQKDILLDLSWDVLKHSQLFAGEDMAFKKTLSMHIKYRYYLPGDIIFRAGNMRAKMIYINSGIIQVNFADFPSKQYIFLKRDSIQFGFRYYPTKMTSRQSCHFQMVPS